MRHLSSHYAYEAFIRFPTRRRPHTLDRLIKRTKSQLSKFEAHEEIKEEETKEEEEDQGKWLYLDG